MKKQDFIKMIAETTMLNYEEHKILPSLSIAQAILESGWGTSKLYKEANAVFGIKASNWNGKIYTIKTKEQDKLGQVFYVKADFRKYNSIKESIIDHNNFLQKERYKKVRETTDFKVACKEIREAGYATDIKYTDKLINLIEQYKLYEYDKEVLKIKGDKIKMNIIQNYLKNNDCYKKNQKITVKGLMIHSIGCPQPKASVLIKSWDKPNVKTCVHAFVEENGNIYQSLPWNTRGWHCGNGSKGSGNSTHIGVEMMEPNTIKYTGKGSSFIDNNTKETRAFVLNTYKVATELFAYLCDKYNLDPLKDGVIISHSEGYKRGISSNHGDVEHLWTKFGLTMNQFRTDINNLLETKYNKKIENKTEIKIDNNFNKYKVKITASALNVREKASALSKIKKVVKKNEIYTIIEENKNWGKLEDGTGWVSLKYTKKI